MKKLLLIDAHALIHRAFHAIPNLTAPDGRPSGALYGLSNVLIKIFREEHPEYAVAFFDRPEPTFRKEMYDAYKAHREKAPDELVSQLIEAHNLFDTFGVKTFDIPGFEGDDLIGTAVEKFKDTPGVQIVILTGDLDALQLVEGKKVVVETLKQGITETIIYDETAVFARYGISPAQLIDYKGLVGDTSDNISGVKGVGPKTATAIITEFGSLENFFATVGASNSTDKKILSYKKIIPHEDVAMLSKTLATIRRDAPLAITTIDELAYTHFPIEDIIPYLKDLGFNSIVRRLTPQDDQQPTTNNLQQGQKNANVNQLSLLDNQQTLSKTLLDDVERPLVSILEEMKEWGILIDRTRLAEKEAILDRDIEALIKELYREAGRVFNPNSPKQLLEILTTTYHLKIKSTNIDKIEPFRATVPLVDLLLKYRELFKLKSTYLEPIRRMTEIDPSANSGQEPRIHPTFVQMKAATGRITCENPNLQNIPPSIREIFVAKPGYKLVSLDYSQIELRILASLTEDPEMLRAFKNNADIHQITASKIYNVALAEVTPAMRKVAKTLNFGVVYGMGPRAFAQQSGLSPKEAKTFIDEYFKDFSTIKKWQEGVLALVRQNGFVENINGRVRPLPDIVSFNKMLQSESERMAINFPIQSVAADIIKSAMVKVKDYLSVDGLWGTDVKMLLTIHDELVFEIKDDERLPKIVDEIKNILESVYTLKVPLIVNVEIGDNWGEL